MRTQWGQRRALGRRYSIDPALQMEQERLAQEYALIPGREARALEAQRLAYQKEVDSENRAAAEKAGMISTAGNVVSAGMTAGMLAKQAGVLGGTKAAVPAATVGTPTATSGIGSTAPAVIDTGATGLGTTGGAGASTTGMTAGEVAAMDAGIGGGVAETGTVAAGEAAGATIGGAASAGAAAAPYAAAGYIAAKIGGSILENAGGGSDSHTVAAQTGRTIQNPLLGIGRAWLDELKITEDSKGKTTTAGHVMNVLNPIGWAFKQSGCIIITACTDRYSTEVHIARKYRDTYLDQDQLRGYYWLADKVVPTLEKSDKARSFCKKWLVDRLIDYGAYQLGLKAIKPLLSSRLVSRLFLTLIKIIGKILPQYVRSNGEVF